MTKQDSYSFSKIIGIVVSYFSLLVITYHIIDYFTVERRISQNLGVAVAHVLRIDSMLLHKKNTVAVYYTYNVNGIVYYNQDVVNTKYLQIEPFSTIAQQRYLVAYSIKDPTKSRIILDKQVPDEVSDFNLTINDHL